MSAEDYIGSELQNMSEIKKGEIENFFRQKFPDDYAKLREGFTNRLHSSDESIRDEAYDEIMKSKLDYFYLYGNQRFPVARFFTAIFYCLGFLILLYPSAKVFLKIIEMAYLNGV